MGAHESRVAAHATASTSAATSNDVSSGGLSRIFSFPPRPPPRAEPYLHLPTYLGDRVLAFQYTGARDEGDGAYRTALRENARALDEAFSPGTVLLISLNSALLMDKSMYDDFNCVVEFCTFWGPPGVGAGGLDSILSACSSAKNWLSMSESNVVCFHVRVERGADAARILRYVVACFETYRASSSEFDIDMAFEELPTVPPRAFSAHRAAAPSRAQIRYGGYFGDAIRTSRESGKECIPKNRLRLKRLVIAGGLSIHNGGWRPYAKVICQSTGVVGKSATQGLAPDWHDSKHGLSPIGMELVRTGHESNTLSVETAIGLSLDGDCVISIFHWTGDETRDELSPVMTFAFHTGFIHLKTSMGDSKAGVMRITRDQMDCTDETLIPDDYFFDLMFLAENAEAKPKRQADIAVQTTPALNETHAGSKIAERPPAMPTSCLLYTSPSPRD